MGISVTGHGKKNPNGFVHRKIVNDNVTTTYTFYDIDTGLKDSLPDIGSSSGLSNKIGTPTGDSSGVQLYYLEFASNSLSTGIAGVRVNRIADTTKNGSTYLTYQVKISLDQNPGHRQMTLGAPSLFNADAAFYFSSLGVSSIGGANGGAAIAGNGYIAGTAFRDCLNGGDGNDTLDGKGGKDYMRGGNGNDTYIVYDLNTQIDEAPQTGIETVISYVDWSLGKRMIASPDGTFFTSDELTATGLDNLTLRGTAINGTGNELNNAIEGNNLNNNLTGGLGNDTLVGGLGNDTLSGGEGSDVLNGFGTVASNASQFDYLTGGAGTDYFVLGGAWGVSYVEPGDGYAIIQDWTTADRIQVRNIGSYSLDSSKSVSGIGGAAKDTEIYFTDASGNRDRIAIIVDSTDVKISRDFKFV